MPNGKLKIYIHFIQYIYSLSLLHSICVQRNAMRLKVDEPNGRAWNETLTFTWQHKAQQNDSTQNKRVHGGKIITFFDVAAAVRLPSNLSCQVDGVVSLKIDLKLCEPRKKNNKRIGNFPPILPTSMERENAISSSHKTFVCEASECLHPENKLCAGSSLACFFLCVWWIGFAWCSVLMLPLFVQIEPRSRRWDMRRAWSSWTFLLSHRRMMENLN